MEKEELRKNLRERRNQLLQKEEKSHCITNHVVSSLVFQNASTVMLYRSTKGEADTGELWEQCQKMGKTCLFPKCVSKTEMIAVLATGENDFSVSKFGILEPISNEIFPKDKIDLVIVPAVGFDQKNYRVGYGGGFYDRYLADYVGNTMGLCFSELITETVFPNEWDIPVMFVATEEGLHPKENEEISCKMKFGLV